MEPGTRAGTRTAVLAALDEELRQNAQCAAARPIPCIRRRLERPHRSCAGGRDGACFLQPRTHLLTTMLQMLDGRDGRPHSFLSDGCQGIDRRGVQRAPPSRPLWRFVALLLGQCRGRRGRKVALPLHASFLQIACFLAFFGRFLEKGENRAAS